MISEARGSAAGALAEVGVGRLQVDRGRVVDRRRDAFGVEVGAQSVAVLAADDVEVEDVVAALAGGDRGDDGGAGERLGQRRAGVAPALVGGVEAVERAAPERRLT